jgi:hypothetical protein
MSLHIAATYLASAPARIGLAVVAAFAALLAVLLATRPSMVMGVVHSVMSMM